MRDVVLAILLVALSPLFIDTEATVHYFTSYTDAKAKCHGSVLWLDTRTGVYYSSEEEDYGHTSGGAYVCENEINAARSLTATPGHSDDINWGDVLRNAVPLVAVLVAAFAAWLSFAGVRKMIWQKANEDELQALQRKLDEFYGPFVELSESSRLLSQDLRHRLKDPQYRMLVYLTKPGWFDGLGVADQSLVGQVCENGDQLARLIDEKAGLIDQVLVPYFGRARTHYRMLRLAIDRKLGNNEEFVKPYVFPEQLPEVVALEIDRIKQRCNKLRAKPMDPPGLMPSLVIPEKLSLPKFPDPPRPKAQYHTSLDSDAAGDKNIGED